MKRAFPISGLLFAGLLLASCGDEGTVTPQLEETSLSPESVSQEIVAAAKWELALTDPAPEGISRSGPLSLDQGESPERHLDSIERQVIAGDIVHYSMQLRVGPGIYDVIGLHRVVRERRPCQPIRTDKNIFLQHGDGKNFVGMFLPGLYSPNMPYDFGVAVYLARNDVDVWGIDQRWNQVPESETSFGFMADWGLGRQIADLRTAVTVARLTRWMTGSGCAKMNLLGYSSGVWTVVGLVNEETQLPPGLRQIGGLIPADAPIKVDYEPFRQVVLAWVDYYWGLYSSGQYQEFTWFPTIAELVRCCPDEPSPFVPDWTNRQYWLWFGGGPIFIAIPTHYWGSVLDPEGMPTAFRFISEEASLDFLASGATYEPSLFMYDYSVYMTGAGDTPYDDHLGEIQVPVLNATPAGGFAETTEYGISLLGSSDKHTLLMSTGLPAAEEYGHIDLFTYSGSEALFWQPMLEWIEAHTP